MDKYPLIYIGIDPGLSGAVAWLTPQGPFVKDIPIVLKGSGFVKNEVDAAGLIRMLDFPGEYHAMLERVNAMPGQGVSSMFSMGDSFGVIRCALAAASIPHEYITPHAWKRHFNLDNNKEAARALAIRLYPTAELHLKKHIDRAEALLIATYCKHTKEAK